PPPPPPPPDINAIGDVLPLSVNFRSGSAVIDKDSYSTLDDVVSKLKERSKLIVELAGHTDNTGPKKGKRETDAKYEARLIKVNRALSLKRAASVKAYLVKKGIGRGRIAVRGAGQTQPVDSNDTEVGRAKNRRIEVKVTGFVTDKPTRKGLRSR
ncbi:MAG: OmpA family protein, partial [Rhizobacter sp.]|nr:OmpA family protein [Chlorobiales bacterium]